MSIIKNKAQILANTTTSRNMKQMGLRMSKNQTDAGQQAQIRQPTQNAYTPSPVKKAFNNFYGSDRRPVSKTRMMKIGQK